MPNPALLVCDTDVLVQLFLASDLRPLTELISGFAIQPVIVPEVNAEIRYVAKYGYRFVADIEKALRHGTIELLDESYFQKFLAQAEPGTSWASFQQLGGVYERRVQRGEAFTHAAAVSLSMPAASNDLSAIETLNAQGYELPKPVLRFFDLLVFAHRTGAMPAKDCDGIRQRLTKMREPVPQAFARASFEAAIDKFNCRLECVAEPRPAERFDGNLGIVK